MRTLSLASAINSGSITPSLKICRKSVCRGRSGVLGENVLGRAILALNLIQIREDLYGLDFEEVKKHEVNHLLYPYMTEWEVRQKTKMELPFYTRFH